MPFEELINEKLWLFIPSFQKASRMAGGTDVDPISRALMVDFKTTQRDSIHGKDLDQIIGDYYLARKQHFVDQAFAVVNRLGLYYSRHANLWSLEASVWTFQPKFGEFEEYCFKRAEEELEISQESLVCK